MANVQSPSTKKALEKEYRFRFLSILLIFFSIAAFTGIILLVPSYLLSRSRMEASAERVSLLAEYRAANEGNEYGRILERLKYQLQFISLLNGDYAFSDLVSVVVEEAGSSITLESLSASSSADSKNPSEGITTLYVGGTANSRDSLLAFTSRLRARREFSEVTLPIGNLAERTNVPFALTIQLTDQYEK